MNSVSLGDSLVYLLSDFQASQGYIVKPYFEKNKIHIKFICGALIDYDR